MTILFIAFAFLATTASSAVVVKKVDYLPDYVDTCQRDSPAVNSCILKSLKNLHPYLIKGISEWGLPPFDPFLMEETFMDYSNGYISAKFSIRNASFIGLREMQYKDVRVDFSDLDNFKLDIDIFVPTLKTDGKYKLQGKLLNSEFGGKGSFNSTMTNVQATWSFSGTREIRDGITYMRMKHLDMEPIVGDMEFYATNLFNGNEALSKSALKLINANWRLAYEELLPYAKKDWDRAMTELANRVFLRVPFDKLFPTSP